MVVFKKKSIFIKANKIKNHGMSFTKKYFHDFVGSNYRLTNIQAAIGFEQLKKIKKLISQRKKIFDFYDKNINERYCDKLPKNKWSINSYWLYVLILKKINRKKIIDFLLKKGIETSTTFYPLNKMKPFRKYAHKKYPNSEYIGNNGICIPSSGLNKKELNYICKTINFALRKFG